jgi:hypothetical protein
MAKQKKTPKKAAKKVTKKKVTPKKAAKKAPLKKNAPNKKAATKKAAKKAAPIKQTKFIGAPPVCPPGQVFCCKDGVWDCWLPSECNC